MASVVEKDQQNNSRVVQPAQVYPVALSLVILREIKMSVK